MQVKSIADCPKGEHSAILSTSLSYHLALRSVFCLFLSDRFTQGLPYMVIKSPDVLKNMVFEALCQGIVKTTFLFKFMRAVGNVLFKPTYTLSKKNVRTL